MALRPFFAIMNSMKNKHPTRAGFTLIELILVVILIIILSAAAIGSIFRSQRAFTFNTASQQVSSMVREARSLAVTGKSILDFTDYDQDTLDDSDGDRVTPAHYGVHFDTGTGTVTIFADMHGSGTEGVYDGTPAGFQTYSAGKDLKIAEYVVPSTLSLLVNSGATGADTVMYSPILADTAFSGGGSSQDLTGKFFVFGIRENTPAPVERCMAIHPISGIPETTDATGESCP